MTPSSVTALPHDFPWKEGQHYRVDPITGCWPWTGKTTKGGHGACYLSELGSGKAHRFAYEALHGETPAGFHVHHACENPPCVNPAHLELLTHSEHSIHHGRASSALTEDDIVAMRAAVWNGERIWQVAERYGITASTCGLICQGLKWRTAGGPVGVPPKRCAHCDSELPLASSRNPRRRKYCNDDCRRAAARKSA